MTRQLEFAEILDAAICAAQGMTRKQVRALHLAARLYEDALDSERRFLGRKYDEQLTDLQMLILLVLAKGHLYTLTDLATEMRRAVNSVSAACTVLEGKGLLSKYWQTHPYKKAPYSLVYMHLSEAGTKHLAWLLGKS